LESAKSTLTFEFAFDKLLITATLEARALELKIHVGKTLDKLSSEFTLDTIVFEENNQLGKHDAIFLSSSTLFLTALEDSNHEGKELDKAKSTPTFEFALDRL
jgi:hypothetical protein